MMYKYIGGGLQEAGIVDPESPEFRYGANQLSQQFARELIERGPTELELPVEVLAAALRHLNVQPEGPTGPESEADYAMARHRGRMARRDAELRVQDMMAGSEGLLAEGFEPSEMEPVPVYDANQAMTGFQGWVTKLVTPYINERAAQLKANDPVTFDIMYREDIAQGEPEGRLLGTTTLREKLGFNETFADILMYTLLDPATIAMDIPILAHGAVTGIKTARWMATEGEAVLQAMGMSGRRLAVDEVDNAVREILNVRENALGRIQLPPELRSAARLELEALAVQNSTQALFRPQAQAAADILTRMATHIKDGKTTARTARGKIEKSFLGREYKKLIDTDVPVSTRDRVAQAWMETVRHDEDITRLQRFLSKVDPDIDVHQWKPSRHQYYDPLTDETFFTRRGFEEEFFRNPARYLETTETLGPVVRKFTNFKKSYEGIAAKLGLNTDEMIDKARRSSYLGVEGTEHRMINEAIDAARRGKSWAELQKTVPWAERSQSWAAQVFRTLRRGEAADPMATRMALLNAEKRVENRLIAIKMRLNSALGGTLTRIEDRVAAQVWSGNPLAMRVDDVSPLMKNRGSLLRQGIGKLKDMVSPERQLAIRNLNDETLVALTRGAGSHLKAINTKRVADGLPKIHPNTLSAEAIENAQRLRPVMDDMARRAREHGLLDLELYITDYMPKLYKLINDDGMSMAEAMRELGGRYGRKNIALFPDRPFFSYNRNEVLSPHDMITDVSELVMRYASALETHINVKPVAEAIIRRAADPRTPLTAGERVFSLEILFQRLGKGTWSEAQMAGQMSKMNDLMGVLDMPAVQDAMLGKVGRYINQQMASMWVNKFLGLDPVKAIRNLTQQTLVPPQIGEGNSIIGLKRMADGLRDFMDDPALQSSFRESANRMGWVGSYDDMASSVMNTRLEALGLGVGRLGDVVPQSVQKMSMAAYTGADMANRVAAYSGGVRALRDAREAGTVGKLLARYKAADRQLIERQLQLGNVAKAEQIIGEATVHGTQWLYSRAMRPLFMNAKVKGLAVQDLPFLGNVLLFWSWGANYMEAAARISMAGVRGQAPNKAVLQLMSNAADHQFVQIANLIAIEAAGHALGIGGQGHFIGPRVRDLSVMGIPIGSEDWRETYAERIIPLPILKNAIGAVNPTAMARNTVEGYRAIQRIVDGYQNDEPGQVGSGLEVLYQNGVFGHKIFTPPLNWLGEELGIEADPSYREDFIDQWLGPVFQFQNQDLTDEQVMLRSIGVRQVVE